MRQKLWQEIFKCHQHKGGESIKPAVQAEGLEGSRGGIRDQGKGEGVLRGGAPRVKLLQTEFPIRVQKL